MLSKREIDKIKEHVSAHELENQIDIIVAKRAGREGQLRDITDAKAMTEEEQKEIRRAKGLAPGTNEKNIQDAYCYIVPYKNSKTGEGRVHFVRNKSITFLKNLLRREKRGLL